MSTHSSILKRGVKKRLDLIWLLRKLKLSDLPVAEIGVAAGHFSEELLRVWEVPKLYAVDAWFTMNALPGDAAYPQKWHDDNLTAAKKRLEPFMDKVVILRGRSTMMVKKVPDKSLGFVYLDACHSYRCVTVDLTDWIEKLVPGGVMAGHDYHNYNFNQVEAAVNDFAEGKYEVHRIPESENQDHSFWFQC